ncbi:MAG: hypothetical protein IJ173_03975, partial [Kiritimatiellae bacterium]|nr:hypothetical protein [Kiritimatiellia bacterium]
GRPRRRFRRGRWRSLPPRGGAVFFTSPPRGSPSRLASEEKIGEPPRKTPLRKDTNGGIMVLKLEQG